MSEDRPNETPTLDCVICYNEIDVNDRKEINYYFKVLESKKDEINAFAGADKKIGAVTNVIGGLASGFQAAQGAAALFGSENEDLQKTLLKVQSAMAFTEGIKGIAGLGDSFKALGNIIKANPLLLKEQFLTKKYSANSINKIKHLQKR